MKSLKNLINFNEIERSIKMTFQLFKNKKENEIIKDETFEEALARFNIKEEDLAKKYSEFRNVSYLYYLFSLTLLCLFVKNLILNDEGIIYLSFLFLISMALLANGVITSYQCYQMKIRKIIKIKEFFKNKKYIIPSMKL